MLKLCLETIDTLNVDAIAIGLPEDLRPLSGTANLIDWRLCGALTALVAKGTLFGRGGETILLSTQNKIPAKRLFVFGLGPSSEISAHLHTALDWMVSVLQKARVESVAFALPDCCEKSPQLALDLERKNLPFRYAGTFERDEFVQPK